MFEDSDYVSCISRVNKYLNVFDIQKAEEYYSKADELLGRKYKEINEILIRNHKKYRDTIDEAKELMAFKKSSPWYKINSEDLYSYILYRSDIGQFKIKITLNDLKITIYSLLDKPKKPLIEQDKEKKYKIIDDGIMIDLDRFDFIGDIFISNQGIGSGKIYQKNNLFIDEYDSLYELNEALKKHFDEILKV